jgi:hypothetical protein
VIFTAKRQATRSPPQPVAVDLPFQHDEPVYVVEGLCDARLTVRRQQRRQLPHEAAAVVQLDVRPPPRGKIHKGRHGGSDREARTQREPGWGGWGSGGTATLTPAPGRAIFMTAEPSNVLYISQREAALHVNM